MGESHEVVPSVAPSVAGKAITRQGGTDTLCSILTAARPTLSGDGHHDSRRRPRRAGPCDRVARAAARLLGDDVVDVALASMRERRESLVSRQVEQRRLVTVLFADLVGFTFLADDLDPEDTRTVVDTYFARWRRIIEEHGGEVEKFIGDAVMAVFGLRRSYEDDPERAVRAALAMLDDLAELNAELSASYDLTLRMRVGIDTGDVVVSTLGRGDGAFVAVGSTVNRAARIQAAAPVDGILVSDSTQRHVRRTLQPRAPGRPTVQGLRRLGRHLRRRLGTAADLPPRPRLRHRGRRDRDRRPWRRARRAGGAPPRGRRAAAMAGAHRRRRRRRREVAAAGGARRAALGEPDGDLVVRRPRPAVGLQPSAGPAARPAGRTLRHRRDRRARCRQGQAGGRLRPGVRRRRCRRQGPARRPGTTPTWWLPSSVSRPTCPAPACRATPRPCGWRARSRWRSTSPGWPTSSPC